MKRFFFHAEDAEKVTGVKKRSLELGLCDKYKAEIVDDPNEADVVIVESEEQYSVLRHEDAETRVFILVINEGQMVSVTSKTLVVSCFNCAAQAVITFVRAQ